MGWYLKVLKNYATFKGRARRTEYWMFSLINFGISLITSFFMYMTQNSTDLAGIFSIIFTLYGIAILIPGMAVTVRRLHDIGKSGWWCFIVLAALLSRQRLFSIKAIIFLLPAWSLSRKKKRHAELPALSRLIV